MGRGVAFGLGNRLHLEFFHRPRHLAEFVLASEARQHDVEIAAGEFAHRLAHFDHGAGNPLAQQQCQRSAEQEASGRQHQDQALGLADGRVRLRFKSLLVGEQVRLHHAGALDDGVGGLVHLGDKSIDGFRVFDQLGQRLPVILEQCRGFLETLHDLFVVRRYRAQRVFDELQARQRAGGDRLVRIDDEGIGERRGRLKLIDHLLGAELNRLQLRIVGVAGEVVELVAQHIGAARQLILRDQSAIALDLENIGENLGEEAEFAGQAGDLIEPRRVGGALHRLVDGVLQAGFGRQRRRGIVFLSGHHVIARQRAVGDQLAVDVARQIGFRNTVAVARDTGRDALKPDIGNAHAGRRDRGHDREAEHDLAAKSKGWKP